MLHLGLAASLGAMCVSNADVPGPVQRRFIAMGATLGLNFLIALIVGLSSPYAVLLGILITVLSFVLTVIAVYGSRVNTVGSAGLIIMVLSLDAQRTVSEVLINSLWLTLGGIWYMLLSIALFRMRPYKIIQQALGSHIFSIGDYLKTRSFFYNEVVDYDRVYKKLMEQQQLIHEQQEMLREMIFKSRSIIRQSTVTSRTLLIIFIETIDFFEKATGSIYNYRSMHKRFDGKNILPKFQKIILEMVDELHQIGLSVQAGRPPRPSKLLNTELRVLKQEYEIFLLQNRSPENIEPLVSMRKIMESIEEMVMRIYSLYHYTRYDRKRIKTYKLEDSYDSFVAPTSLNYELLLQTLTFSSNTFRHAIRVSMAMLTGFVVARLLNLGHSYWVLLTILVILKPSYSLTKQRNYHRLIGTLIGAVAGTAFIFLIRSEPGLLIAMVLLMLGTYAFIRTKYFTGVIFMTSYLMIFFFILDAANFVDLLKLRIVDTLIGSVIAFTATNILVPSWEKKQMRIYMGEAIEKVTAFFTYVGSTFTNKNMDAMEYRLQRKDAFVAQANLSGGLTRMLNEPKSKQEKIRLAHEFVVLITTLNSHIVTLAGFAQLHAAKYRSADFEPIVNDTILELNLARTALSEPGEEQTKTKTTVAENLKVDIQELVDRRRHELKRGLLDTETKYTLLEYKPIVDQFLFINSLGEDINKVIQRMNTNQT